MPRPRSFDKDDVIRKLLLVFWRKGYEATSLTDLEAASGLGRASLYAAFGDKENMFEAALSRYIAATRRLYDKLLTGGGLADIDRLIAAHIDEEKLGKASGWGCPMVNAVASHHNVNIRVRRAIADFRAYAVGRIEAELVAAIAQGELVATTDCRVLAEFIVSTFWGIKSAVRHAGSAKIAVPLASSLSKLLRAAV